MMDRAARPRWQHGLQCNAANQLKHPVHGEGPSVNISLNLLTCHLLIMQYLHHELHVCLLTNPTSSASSTFGSLLMQTVVCKRRCMTPRLSPSLPPADDSHESQAHQTNCATHNHGEQRKRRVLRVVMIAVRSVFTAFVDDLDDSQHLVVRRASGARIMFTKNLRMHTIWPYKSDAPQPTSLREHPAL